MTLNVTQSLRLRTGGIGSSRQQKAEALGLVFSKELKTFSL